jgi:hypothetical protein
MGVYVVVAIVVIAILWAAYRALGSAASRAPDNLALLRQAVKSGTAAARELRGPAAGSTAEPLETPQRSVRRVVDGCAQLLERVDAATLEPEQLAAHPLLIAAVEDLSWAARIGESESRGANAGLQRAFDQLLTEAERGLADAGALLGSRIPEEADSPA